MTRADLAAGLTAATGFLARASNQIAALVVTLVATRYLSPAEFGTFALASVAITLIRTFLYSGAFEYLLKAPDARDCSSESLAVNLLLAAALSALIGGLALAGRHLFAADAICLALLALLPSNLIAALTAWRESLLLRTGRLRLYYGLTTLAEFLAIAVAIGLLFAGFKLWALIGQVYARVFATLLLYAFTGRATLSARFSAARFVAVLRWSVGRYATVLVAFGSNYSADLFLGIFLSPAATGLYRASNRMVTAASDMFSQPARTIAMTLFSARAAAGRRSAAAWPILFVLFALVAWAALAGLAAVAPLVVPLLLGDGWRGAAALVPILCLAHALPLFDGIATAALVAADQQRPLFYVQCAAAAVGGLLLALVAPFGIVPATVAGAATAMLTTAVLARIALRRLPGSAASLRRAAPALIAPVFAAAVGALAGRIGGEAAGMTPGQMAAVAIVTGVAAWIGAILLIRHRLLAMILHLRAEPVAMPAMAVA